MITYHMFTNEGNHKPNEDTVGMTEQNGKYCFAVADGLGGHGMGDKASQLVVGEAMKLFLENEENPNFIAETFEKGQAALLDAHRKERTIQGMKTTMVLLSVGENAINFGHIGDTRLYYFRKNRLMSRTLDHSVPQMLVNARKIKEKEIRNHPDRNRLLRVMGTEWNGAEYEIGKSIKRERGKRQAFLMCTDGFWELIDEKEMIKCLKKASDVETWVTEMSRIVTENGKNVQMDNYSAIGIFVE